MLCKGWDLISSTGKLCFQCTLYKFVNLFGPKEDCEFDRLVRLLVPEIRKPHRPGKIDKLWCKDIHLKTCIQDMLIFCVDFAQNLAYALGKDIGERYEEWLNDPVKRFTEGPEAKVTIAFLVHLGCNTPDFQVQLNHRQSSPWRCGRMQEGIRQHHQQWLQPWRGWGRWPLTLFRRLRGNLWSRNWVEISILGNVSNLGRGSKKNYFFSSFFLPRGPAPPPPP